MDFLVKRDDLHECRIADSEPPELQPGEALLSVSAFGLTSNNVTYAVFGDAMSYWDFFPAAEGWGRVPVWGFADVAASNQPGLEAGVRIYGYLPPSSHLVVKPDPVDERGFVDSSPHRAALPSAYNGYLRTEGDSFYDADTEDAQMLLRPLFFTSFLLDDFIGSNDSNEFFGADVVVISSASSKTASAAAFLLARRGGVEVVGLTSPRNVAFVERLGVYDRVVSYDDLDSLPEGDAVLVDIAGNAPLRGDIHRRYGDRLKHSAVVGDTHWDNVDEDEGELPGAPPAFFFAPDHVSRRSADWGRDELDKRVAEAWKPYVKWAQGWLEVEHASGPEAIERVYRQLLDGGIDPAVAHVLSPG